MTENSLIPIEENKALMAFKTEGGLEPLLVAIEKEARAVPVVLNTQNGRDNIASLAYKIARTKTTVDAIGKGLNQEHQKQIDLVNAARNIAWARFESLQKEIRKPLDDWEAAEKARKGEHEALLVEMEKLAIFDPEANPEPTSAEIQARMEKLEEDPNRTWDEYSTRAARIKRETMDKLAESLLAAQAREEAARIAEEERVAEEKRKQAERDAEIARVAAEEARRIAQEEAEIDIIWERAHRENAEFDTRKAEERAEYEEDLKWQAIYAAADAENESFDRALIARRVAQVQAEDAAARAVQAERDKLEKEKKEADAAVAKRQADEEHRIRINNEAQEAIERILVMENSALHKDIAARIILAISQGEIPNVTIKY